MQKSFVLSILLLFFFRFLFACEAGVCVEFERDGDVHEAGTSYHDVVNDLNIELTDFLFDLLGDLSITSEELDRRYEERRRQLVSEQKDRLLFDIVEYALEDAALWEEPIPFPKRKELGERRKMVKRLGVRHGVSQRDALRKRALAKVMILKLKKSLRTDPSQHGEVLKNSFALLASLKRHLN